MLRTKDPKSTSEITRAKSGPKKELRELLVQTGLTIGVIGTKGWDYKEEIIRGFQDCLVMAVNNVQLHTDDEPNKLKLVPKMNNANSTFRTAFEHCGTDCTNLNFRGNAPFIGTAE